MVGGSQFPLTHVQLAPGWTVVQLLVDVVGATQLPFTQVHPVPGEAVVHGGGGVGEPVVCSTSCAMTRLNASLATTRNRPFAAPPAAWGWLARVVPDTVRLELGSRHAVAVDFDSPHLVVLLALVYSEVFRGHGVVRDADAVAAAIGCDRQRRTPDQRSAGVEAPASQHPTTAAESPGDAEV